MADPFADIPIKGESKDPFADIPVKPSFGEKAEGFVYGLATGIPGMLGDIETMLPGGSEVGVKGQGALKGKETVFPTTENIREGLTKMGLPPPPNPAVKGYITAGEVAPAVVAGGKGLYEAGKGLYGGAKMLGERLALGKTSKALAEDLRLASKKQAGQIAKTSGEEMTAAEQRAAIAGKAEEKAGRGGEIALKPLPGVTTEMEAGRFKPIAQTAQDIGTKIKDSANRVVESFKAKREVNAKINKQAAFGEAFQKEAAGQNISQTKAYKDTIQEIDAMIKNPTTDLSGVPVGELEAQLKKIRGILDRTIVDVDGTVIARKPANFEGLEDARRWLRDKSYGVPAQGYDAISQQMAGHFADRIEAIQKEFSPKIEKFLTQYKKDSEPLRVFQTKVGKALTDTQLPGTDFATVAAQDIPGRVFKSKENYNALVDAFGGDRKLAEAEAKRYFASQLESKGTAKEAENFIRQNRAMLKETNSLPMAEKYAIDLRTYESRTGAAGQVKKSEETIAKEKKQLVQDYQTFESDLSVAANDPTKIVTASNNLAKRMLDHGQIDQMQYRELQRQIEKVRLTVRDANQMKDQIKLFVYRALGYGAVATVGGYGAMKAFE
jgi:hypothetical protein